MLLEDMSLSMKCFRENSSISLYETVPSEEYAVFLLYLRNLLFSTSPVFQFVVFLKVCFVTC